MKIDGKTKKWRIHGLRQRWLVTSVLTVSVVIVMFVIIFSVVITNYYYTSIKSGLEVKAKTATDFFANYITLTSSEYYDSAYKYIEKLEDANILELQFISNSGRVEVSSYGIISGRMPGTPDIEKSLSSGEISSWMGENPGTGEHIMAVSAPMIYSDGQIIGAMRYITSLKLVNREIISNITVAAGFGMMVIFLILAVNLFFIRSVVEPVREITSMVRQIADGSYGVKINRRYKDEIGDMVDSINEMSMKISQSEKTQTEFISSVSHELRTPLTAITGWGETLIYDEGISMDVRRGIGIILKEARRLTKMVEELLEFTRMQDGRFTLNIEQIDIGAELEDSIFTYKELFRQDEIDLQYDPPMEELPLINGDPERLRQVFLNILDNAAKYGREGKRIVVSIWSDTDSVSVAIRDFGPGISEDDLENVKMKFYKGSSKERGSGIGLAVCDEIVKYHRGQLILANAEGGGLIVTIRLPVDHDIKI